MLVLTFERCEENIAKVGMRRNNVEFRYKHIEAALADVLNVPQKKMGAFRARIRHLRNIGLPQLPKPGSGQQIAYTRRHALEIILALRLQDIGQAPQAAADQAQMIVRQSPHQIDLSAAHKLGDMYAAVQPGAMPVTLAYGRKSLAEVLDRAPVAFSLVNVSACARELDDALNRESARD
jgi:hypothetical protein